MREIFLLKNYRDKDDVSCLKISSRAFFAKYI